MKSKIPKTNLLIAPIAHWRKMAGFTLKKGYLHIKKKVMLLKNATANNVINKYEHENKKAGRDSGF